MTSSPEFLLQTGLTAHRAGNTTLADASYRRLLELHPGHPDAHHLLGLLALQQKNFSAAVDRFRTAIALSPGTAMFHLNLGKALYAQSDMPAAAESLNAAIAHDPALLDAHLLLASALIATERYTLAADAAKTALRFRPAYPPALISLGTARRLAGQLDLAYAAFHQAAQLAPQLFEAALGLGAVLRAQRNTDEALAILRRAAALGPSRFEPFLELGELLAHAGHHSEAIIELQRALQHNPACAPAHLVLGAALHKLNRDDDALTALRQAAALRPDLPEIHYNLGVIEAARTGPHAAIPHYQQALALQPNYPAALVNLAESLRVTAHLAEALLLVRRAVDLQPDNSLIHSALLYALHFSDAITSESLLAEHRRWADRHIAPLLARALPNDKLRDSSRRLRLGYVSPDFRDHPVARYLLPVLTYHDKAQFDIFLYSSVAHPDAFTARCRSAADHFREVAALSDEALARQIREDQIDILIDLSLHMANNRMLAFARRPAPVQISGFGYPSTTGNPAIDLRISDPHLDPLENSLEGPEKIARLPHSFWCFSSHDDTPPPRPLPALASGHITFGSLNNPAKITPAAIHNWAAVLHAVPRSRFVQLSATSGDAALIAAFAAQGIDPARLDFIPKAPRPAYLDFHRRIDIALDPFPYTGHSTSCDAFWMGVPVLALATFDKTSLPVSRAGASILHALNLPEFIAKTPEALTRIAAALAADVPGLNALSATLRDRMRSSPLMDAPAYTLALEAIYRKAWIS